MPLSRLGSDTSVAAIAVLSGKPDIFIAGADIEEFVSIQTREEAETRSREGQTIMNRIADSPKPVIVGIHGVAGQITVGVDGRGGRVQGIGGRNTVRRLIGIGVCVAISIAIACVARPVGVQVSAIVRRVRRLHNRTVVASISVEILTNGRVQWVCVIDIQDAVRVVIEVTGIAHAVGVGVDAIVGGVGRLHHRTIVAAVGIEVLADVRVQRFNVGFIQDAVVIVVLIDAVADQISIDIERCRCGVEGV